MSFKVLVVPEDPTLNGYILKPLIARMVAETGKPNAEVKVVDSPRARGYANAKQLLIDVYVERYRHFDLFLFLPDADGKN